MRRPGAPRAEQEVTGLLFPKPAKNDRPGEKRKREIKRKDREFQEDIPPGSRCLIGTDCKGPLAKHHRKRRRYLKTRWDDDNAWILCKKHHIFELHVIGEKAFCRKYGLA